MSHIRGHRQRFTPVFVRDVPLPGTYPTFYPHFRPRCPTSGDISNVLPRFLSEMSPSGDISNVLPPFSSDMSHIRGHLQRFTPNFDRDVPYPGTLPTFYPHFRPRCPTFRDISNVLTPFSSEMSHLRGHLQRFTPVFVRHVPLSGTSPTF